VEKFGERGKSTFGLNVPVQSSSLEQPVLTSITTGDIAGSSQKKVVLEYHEVAFR